MVDNHLLIYNLSAPYHLEEFHSQLNVYLHQVIYQQILISVHEVASLLFRKFFTLFP